MTTFEPSAPAPLRLASVPLRVAPALFATTLFVSALLLFAVQPMFTKMLLPRLGGAPAVWSVAIVVFQAALLLGYAYAHLVTRMLRPGLAALVHLAVLAAASLALPIGLARGFEMPPESGVVLWLVGLIAASIGLPFAALSASAPLLQSWFAASGHPQARNPYVLYAASNVGSFAALIAYPFLIEPLLTLRTQAWAWSLGYAVLACMIAVAGLLVARGAQTATAATLASAPAPTLKERLVWVTLAAIPSGLVVAVTAHITTEVAAAPFLWVVPLALYLLTFVAVFRDRPWISHDAAVRLAPFAVVPLAIGIFDGSRSLWLIVILLNLAAFFLLTLACHGEIYRRRPPPARLTEFYLWLSFGGVVGGVFAGLVAPNVFPSTYEYQILIVAALLALPGTFAGGWRKWATGGAWLAAALAALAIPRLVFDARLPDAAAPALQVAAIALGTLMLLQRHRPARLAGLVVVAFTLIELWRPGLVRIETARSFFGVHQVVESADGRFRLLFHGATIHGAERIGEAGPRPQPRTYYYFGGPISEAIEAARATQGGLRSVGVIGLGTGSLACHQKPDEAWTFFEIDPEVARIARDPRLFSFLGRCAPGSPVVLGDARLTLPAAPRPFDVIVLDAFSSDSIPVHLLTREAFAGYLSRLSPGGTIVLHISNRHLELVRVVAAVAAAEGLVAWLKQDVSVTDPREELHANALVAALARKPADLGDVPNRPGWRRIESDIAPWTDDYSDILGALLRKKFGR